jgi:hypothetical protein
MIPTILASVAILIAFVSLGVSIKASQKKELYKTKIKNITIWKDKDGDLINTVKK